MDALTTIYVFRLSLRWLNALLRFDACTSLQTNWVDSQPMGDRPILGRDARPVAQMFIASQRRATCIWAYNTACRSVPSTEMRSETPLLQAFCS